MILFIAASLGLQDAPAPQSPVLRGTGLFVYDAHTEERYPAASVPYRPGDICYEWVVWVEPENRSLAIREEFELPAANARWGQDPNGRTVVNADRRSAVTEFTDDLADTQISHRWCIDEGDPVGPYRIRVFTGDQLLEDFQFDVVPDGPASPH